MLLALLVSLLASFAAASSSRNGRPPAACRGAKRVVNSSLANNPRRAAQRLPKEEAQIIRAMRPSLDAGADAAAAEPVPWHLAFNSLLFFMRPPPSSFPLFLTAFFIFLLLSHCASYLLFNSLLIPCPVRLCYYFILRPGPTIPSSAFYHALLLSGAFESSADFVFLRVRLLFSSASSSAAASSSWSVLVSVREFARGRAGRTEASANVPIWQVGLSARRMAFIRLVFLPRPPPFFFVFIPLRFMCGPVR